MALTGSIVQQFKGRSHDWNLRIPEAAKDRTRLEVQLATQA
jgi:hypothetical protein